DGSNPRIAGFLEDHAHLVDGLIALYQATFDIAWLDWAIDLTQRMITDFSDDQAATFFDTSAAHDQLMVRIRDLQDGATPCGNSVAWGVLLKLGNLTGNQAWIDRATGSLAGMARYMEGQPLGFGRFLVAATESIGVVREVAIATDERNATVEAFAKAVYARFEPNALVALVEPDAIGRIPWLADRPVRNGQTTAYLCEQFVCLPPVTSPADLTAQLEMGTGMSWSSF
ncbi:MAG TPA: hypothetical protein PK691_08480, partial [Thermomicrobiales bacterium]|nr:hypothetical protein [Thermomicrobiales bacterium]